MEKKNFVKKEKKTRKKLSKGGLVLLIGCIIIAIPCLIFGGILLGAALQTGKPVQGSRFDNDLNPAISSVDSSSLESSIKGLSGVENCEIVLTSAQYRINVDTNDLLSEDEINNLCVEIYNTVNSKLPISTYFTSANGKKMYDLSINVYNFIDSENEEMTYFILTKNGEMSEYSIQCVSKPQDEELAKELRGETNLTTGTGDVQGEMVDEESGEVIE